MPAILVPNGQVTGSNKTTIIVVWSVIFLIWWSTYPPAIIPKPIDTLNAWLMLFTSGNLAVHIASSLELNIYAIVASTVISLVITYTSLLPIFRPIAKMVSYMRYMGLTGVSFVFTLLASGLELKVMLLTFGMTVFFVTSMLAVVENIEADDYRLARSLGMGPWQTMYEVVIRGTLHHAFDILRQNAAIGWLMLTAVEGLVRSGGGLGLVLLNENKAFHLEQIFALQITVLTIALFQDYLFGWAYQAFFRYATLSRGR